MTTRSGSRQWPASSATRARGGCRSGCARQSTITPSGEVMPTVRLEFYGQARHRAGRAELSAEAATVGAALAAADAACPGLRVLRDNGLSPEYLVSVGGKR